MPKSSKLIPEAYEPVKAPAATPRPVPSAADLAAVVAYLRALTAGKHPIPWATAVLGAQLVLAAREVWLTNDEADALVTGIEAKWHPGGIPAEYAVEAVGVEAVVEEP